MRRRRPTQTTTTSRKGKQMKPQKKSGIKKILCLSLSVLSGAADVFAEELKTGDGGWIDLPVMGAVSYFESLINSFYIYATQIGMCLGLIGIVYECVKLAFGTMETKQFFVGLVMKWFVFSLLMSFYPAAVSAVKVAAMEIGVKSAGNTVSLAQDNLVGMLKTVEDILQDERTQVAKDLAWDGLKAYGWGGAAAGLIAGGAALSATGVLAPLGATIIAAGAVTGIFQMLVNANKAAHKVRVLTGAEKSKYAKKADSLRRILGVPDDDGNMREGESKSRKYFLNIWIPSDNGKSYMLSPSAIFKITLFNSQLIWENQFSDGFEDIVDEKGATVVDKSSQSGKKAKAFKNKLKKQTLLEMGIESVGYFFIKILLIVFMLFTMAAVLIQYIMAIIEYSVITAAGVLLIPFLLFDGTKDMTQKLLPTIFAQAMKLLMITITICFTLYIQTNLAIDLLNESGSFNLTDFAYFLFSFLLCFTICSNAPKIASALMTGQPQLSMGEFVATAGAAVALGGRAAGGVAGAAQSVGGGVVHGVNGFAAMRAADANWRGDRAAGKGAFMGAMEGGATKAEAEKARRDIIKERRLGRSTEAWENMKKGGGSMHGGGGGSAGGMYNAGYRTERTDKDYEKNLPGGLNSVNYTKAQNANGTSMTRKEFIKDAEAKAKAAELAKWKSLNAELRGEDFSLNRMSDKQLDDYISNSKEV